MSLKIAETMRVRLAKGVNTRQVSQGSLELVIKLNSIGILGTRNTPDLHTIAAPPFLNRINTNTSELPNADPLTLADTESRPSSSSPPPLHSLGNRMHMIDLDSLDADIGINRHVSPDCSVKLCPHPSSGAPVQTLPLKEYILTVQAILRPNDNANISINAFSPFSSRADLSYAEWAIDAGISNSSINDNLKRARTDWTSDLFVTFRSNRDIERCFDYAEGRTLPVSLHAPNYFDFLLIH